MPDLLLELFSEEIPARMQPRAAEDLQRLVTDGLVAAGLACADARAFATPRRLVLAVEGLAASSAPRREERRGPREDAPASAIEGFLRATGLAREQLELREERKGRFWFAVIETPGRPAAAIVAETVEAVVRDFPWPKSMRWGAGGLRWVRPLQSILCILHGPEGAETVPLEIDGIVAGNATHGHRFLAPQRISVCSFEDYVAKLKRAKVILDARERADRIWIDAHNGAFARGLEVIEDKGLLGEVAGLVEWPVVLLGDIAPDFLDLPPEVLRTSMREHQKFFSVRNPASGRIEGFVTVANIEAPDDGATILAGNAKVLTARLSDAKFFWENDLRTVRQGGLEAMAEGLAQVTFHNKLGTQAQRIERISKLAAEIAPHVGADPEQAALAARVAKADLRSEMVGEFPELQGVMGTYYARAQGLPEAVAAACREHYQPLGPSDTVPTAPVSVAVALADKIDTLTGFWAIDEKPTGSKDPYALRRAALGVIRLILGGDLRLHFLRLCLAPVRRARAAMVAAGALSSSEAPDLSIDSINEECALVLSGEVLSFLHDRLKVHLREQGIPHDVIDACLAMPGNDDLTLLVKRAEALAACLKTDDGENLVQGFRRANNILVQAEEKDGVSYELPPDPRFAEAGAEEALFAALDRAEQQIAPAMAAEDFAAAMQAMAGLRAPVDAFFEAVQVNSDHQIVRRNRLCLLHRIREICGQVADLTRLEG